MKHRSLLSSLLFAALVIGPTVGVLAQTGEGSAVAADTASGDEKDVSTDATPWLKGVTLPPKPEGPAPVVPVSIVMPSGEAIPATVTEDIPILFGVDTELLGDKPPTMAGDIPLTNAEWVGVPTVNWFFDDVGKNESTLASCSQVLPRGQMYVTPINPCRKGAVTVHISRQLKYQEANGQYQRVWANGGRALNMVVTDITPPLCGFKLTAGEKGATVWAIENPLNHYPPPKTVDIQAEGDAVVSPDGDGRKLVAGIPMGGATAVAREALALHFPKGGEVKVELVLSDNDKVDDRTVKFGLCEFAGGAMRPVGPANPQTFQPAKLDLPKNLHFFVEAKDLSGNLGTIIIPVEFK